MALALALAGSLAVSPDARQAVAGFLHLPGFEIRKVQTLPSPSASPTGTRPVTLAQARKLAGFTLLTPAAPEKVLSAAFNGDPPGGEVVLSLAGGAKVMEVKGGIDKGTFGKMVPAEGQVTEVSVNGTTGYWFKGLHYFFYQDATGQFRNEDMLLASDTLVFEKGGVLVRIEGAADEADALRIAALLR